MASFADLSLKNRLFMTTYRYRVLDPVPFALPSKSLSSSRIAVVTTGGLYAHGQPPFDVSLKGGDVSFRVIGSDVEVSTLGVAHKSDAFDETGLLEDRNLGFPLDRLREMAARGEIGEVSRRHLSFMGSITAPGRLMADTAPRGAEILAADGVDVALLVPL